MNLLTISKFRTMKAVEERAKDYADKQWGRVNDYRAEHIAKHAYIAGATEQQVIDDVSLQDRLQKALDRQKQHLIDFTCQLLTENLQCGVHPCSAYGFVDMVRKAMMRYNPNN